MNLRLFPVLCYRYRLGGRTTLGGQEKVTEERDMQKSFTSTF